MPQVRREQEGRRATGESGPGRRAAGGAPGGIAVSADAAPTPAAGRETSAPSLGSGSGPPPPPDGTKPLAVGAPLLGAFVTATRRDDTPFSVPGHKRRSRALDADLGLVADADIPLFGGLDTMKLTGGALPRAEALAARLWNADWCRFSVGGATQANQALLLATGSPGDQIVMSRSIHRSVFSGLILAGLRPVWLTPRTDPASTLPLGPTPGQLASALDAAPGATAVWISEPSYLGTVADVAGLARIAHSRGVPLLVDQAWGAHLGFHPGYPPHALAAGADAMVISAHKMLPAYSQAALVLAREGYLSPRPGWRQRSTPPPPPARRGRSWPAPTAYGSCWPRAARSFWTGWAAWSTAPARYWLMTVPDWSFPGRVTSRRPGSTRPSWC